MAAPFSVFGSSRLTAAAAEVGRSGAGGAMTPVSDILRIQGQIADVLGDETFNHLVDSIPATKKKGRLRFWQEQFLAEAARQTGIRITDYKEFLRVFETAVPREIQPGPWTRDVFLRAIEAFPLGG